jgi:hypothetical protein
LLKSRNFKFSLLFSFKIDFCLSILLVPQVESAWFSKELLNPICGDWILLCFSSCCCLIEAILSWICLIIRFSFLISRYRGLFSSFVRLLLSFSATLCSSSLSFLIQADFLCYSEVNLALSLTKEGSSILVDLAFDEIIDKFVWFWFVLLVLLKETLGLVCLIGGIW